MKNLIKNKGWVTGAALLLAGMVAAGGALAAITGVKGTKHDLSASGGAAGNYYYTTDTNQTQICVFCHTPHGASTAAANMPLWNRDLSAAGSYGVYSNTNSLDTTDIAAVTSTDGSVTSLCMSCHDGTVALNSLKNFPNPGTSSADLPMFSGRTLIDSGRATYLGGSLSNDHPVNFTYDNDLVSKDTLSSGNVAGLVAPATATSNGVRLFNNKVQCASCHNPHDATNSSFLRVTMAASQLCTTCHIK